MSNVCAKLFRTTNRCCSIYRPNRRATGAHLEVRRADVVLAHHHRFDGVQRLPPALLRVRFQGVEDGGADQQVRERAHDQRYGADVLFLHSSWRPKGPVGAGSSTVQSSPVQSVCVWLYVCVCVGVVSGSLRSAARAIFVRLSVSLLSTQSGRSCRVVCIAIYGSGCVQPATGWLTAVAAAAAGAGGASASAPSGRSRRPSAAAEGRRRRAAGPRIGGQRLRGWRTAWTNGPLEPLPADGGGGGGNATAALVLRWVHAGCVTRRRGCERHNVRVRVVVGRTLAGDVMVVGAGGPMESGTGGGESTECGARAGRLGGGAFAMQAVPAAADGGWRVEWMWAGRG